jgi:hypothetical protein
VLVNRVNQICCCHHIATDSLFFNFLHEEHPVALRPVDLTFYSYSSGYARLLESNHKSGTCPRRSMI